MRRAGTMFAILLCHLVVASALAGKAEGDPKVRNSLGMEMVPVPPGEFTMGSKQSPEALARRFGVRDHTRFYPEMPLHLTTIGRGFCMSACEVTVGQFRQFVEATGYKTRAEGGGESGAGRRGGRIISEAGTYVWREDASWRRCGFVQDESHPVVMVVARCTGLLPVAVAEGGRNLPLAHRSRVGICMSRRHGHGQDFGRCVGGSSCPRQGSHGVSSRTILAPAGEATKTTMRS